MLEYIKTLKNMKFVIKILRKIKEYPLKYKKSNQDAFIAQGAEEFKKLIEKGLGVPVALL